ncbi:hypothetical protein Q7Q91_12375 [Lactiplantibacillus pentosus]|nr:hypothetical protein [Lactiplantibacillus pentosus]MDO7805779.1 hypothetical protein [Lactiplantibacillus pentosus]
MNALKRQRNVIDDCLDDAGKDTGVIINELYFCKRPQYTIDGLITSHLINVSCRNAFRLKNSFIKECAKGFGLYDVD